MTGGESNQPVSGWAPTADHLVMQLTLFSGVATQQPPSREEIAAILNDLRAHPELRRFRIWLVGSQLDPSCDGADVDVVLSADGTEAPPEREIDRALWVARAVGVRREAGRVEVDATYRPSGPCRTLTPLLPDSPITSVQLLSPRRMHELLIGKMHRYRMIGRFCMEFTRRARATNFYSKLPRREFESGNHPFLRPALEVVAGLRPSDLSGS